MSKILKKDELLEIQKNVDPFLMMDEVEIVSENKVVGKKNLMKNFQYLDTIGLAIQMCLPHIKLRQCLKLPQL